MNNLYWKPFYYNGIETNVEVTRCGRVRKLKKDWYGNGKGAYQIKIGEIDFNKLKLHKNGYKHILVQIKGFKKKSFFVHQLIATVFLEHKLQGHKLVVDHLDSNKLNNHVDNLKIVTHRQNLSKERTKKSNLPVGVHFAKDRKKYVSQIRINGKRKNLGEFKTIEEASNAYNNKLKTLLWTQLQ